MNLNQDSKLPSNPHLKNPKGKGNRNGSTQASESLTSEPMPMEDELFGS